MRFTEYLEKHPLVFLIGIGVAVSGTTAATVNYFDDKANHAEISKIETTNVIEISKLQYKLMSVERKFGEETDYFDVSKLIVPKQMIRNLGPDFKEIEDGKFYVLEPNLTDWTYAHTTELDLASATMTVVKGGEDPLKIFRSTLGESHIHLWRGKDQISFSPKGSEKDFSFNFFPYVSVQVLQIAQLESMVRGIGKEVANSRDSDIDDVTQVLTNFLRSENSYAKDNITDTPQLTTLANKQDLITDPAIKPNEIGNASTASQSLPLRKKAEDGLSKLFRGDIGTLFLTAISQQVSSMPVIFPGSEANLETVQKKANVLYVQSSVKFNDITATTPGGLKSVTINQEWLICISADNVYVVKIQVPSINGRAYAAFQWLAEFLSGLRVPIKAT